MRPLAKVALVFGGFLGAVVLASVVVTAHVAATSGPDRQQYGAMFGFGDDLLFLAVFGVAAVVPFGTALYFLRSRPYFWRVLCGSALAVAATALAMFFSDAHSAANAWLALAGLLRTLISPFFALACLVAAAIAPSRGPRRALLLATVMEASVLCCVALTWLHRLRAH